MRSRASTGGEDVGAGEEKASTGGGVGAGWGSGGRRRRGELRMGMGAVQCDVDVARKSGGVGVDGWWPVARGSKPGRARMRAKK